MQLNRFAACFLLVTVTAAASRAEDICSSGNLLLQDLRDKRIVELRGVDSVRLESNINCDVKNDCDYSLAISSGSGFVATGPLLRINGICESTRFFLDRSPNSFRHDQSEFLSLFTHIETVQFSFSAQEETVSVVRRLFHYGRNKPAWGTWDSDQGAGDFLQAPTSITEVSIYPK